MPGIGEIQTKQAEKRWKKFSGTDIRATTLGSVLGAIKEFAGLGACPGDGSKRSKKNNVLVPDGAYALDQLPELTGVGFKELEGFVKKGNLIAYKFSKNSQTYVLKENLHAFQQYLQKNFNYLDMKWQKGDVDVE